MVAAQIHDAEDRPEPRQHVGYRHLRTETVRWMKCDRSNRKKLYRKVQAVLDSSPANRPKRNVFPYRRMIKCGPAPSPLSVAQFSNGEEFNFFELCLLDSPRLKAFCREDDPLRTADRICE